MAMVLPAIAEEPKLFTEACTKILAKQNTAPWMAEGIPTLRIALTIFTGVGQYIQPIIATNYGGGNCGVIHQCHVFEIFSDIRVLRKNSEDEVTDSKYVSCMEHYSMVNFN